MHLFATDITDGFYKVLKAFTQLPTTFGVTSGINEEDVEAVARQVLSHDSIAGAQAALETIPGMEMIKIFSSDESRNGPAYRYNYPFIVSYTDPCSRVLQCAARKPNPFFHLYEALWMLAGRDDVARPAMFAKQIKEYSDDGKTLHGAYGHRWRHHFRGDQLRHVIEQLKRTPNSRRIVLQMWDAPEDFVGFSCFNELEQENTPVPFSKDLPCNTHCYFLITDGKLDLTVCNRSNDIIWGMLGSNYVTFSVLLEYVAQMVGIPVGNYHQISNNAHVYTDMYPLETLSNWVEIGEKVPKPPKGDVIPLVCDPTCFDAELQHFVEHPFTISRYREPFLRDVAQPMMQAWDYHKSGQYENCQRELNLIIATDWQFNCKVWMMQRQRARQGK